MDKINGGTGVLFKIADCARTVFRPRNTSNSATAGTAIL